MKKLLLISALFCFACLASAQTVQESAVQLDKQSIIGYTITLPNVGVDLASAAMKNKLETLYALKSSRYSGYKAYLNQPFQPFGTANYDIYVNVEESGKKSNKITTITMIVCNGNLNAVTSQNNPETATNIKAFLTDFVSYVQEYALQQQVNELNNNLTKLNTEKTNLLNTQTKLKKQMESLNKELDNVNKNLETNEDSIKAIQEKLQKLQNASSK